MSMYHNKIVSQDYILQLSPELFENPSADLLWGRLYDVFTEMGRGGQGGRRLG